MLVGKQGLSLKHWGKIYQCCVRPVLLYGGETWEHTVADEARRCGVECCMIRMICGVRLVDRVSTDVFRDRLSVLVKIEDMLIQSFLREYGHIMCGDINSQILEIMVVEITGKRRNFPQEIVRKCIKNDFERYGLSKRGCVLSKELARAN